MNIQNNPTIIEMTARRIDYLRIQTNLSVWDLAKESGIATSASLSFVAFSTIYRVLNPPCCRKFIFSVKGTSAPDRSLFFRQNT